MSQNSHLLVLSKHFKKLKKSIAIVQAEQKWVNGLELIICQEKNSPRF